MTYESSVGGRVGQEASDAGRDDFWTYEAVLERLVEAMQLWKRSPGGGRWPFASDAPWHLMTRATRLDAGRVKGMDLQRLLQEDDERETQQWQGRERPGPLTREDVARRDEATEWLGWVGDDARKVVVAALAQLANGRSTIDWRRIKAALGAEIESKGLYRRFTKAVAGIVQRLNAAD